jgi:O-antigen ligase
LGSINSDFFDFILHIRNRNSLFYSGSPYFFKSKGIIRLASIFDEPSNYAYFIVLTSPIVYFLSFTKTKIFKNKQKDFWLKKALFSLMIINFLLTMSTGFTVVVAILLSLLFFSRTILNPKRLGITMILLPLILFMCGVIYVLLINYQDFLMETSVVISRVVNIITNLNNFEALIIVDNSFANRIVSFVNCFEIFKKNPLIGVGYGNLSYVIIDQLLYHSPLPLTLELKESLAEDLVLINPSIFFRLLSETGILGSVLLYSFLVSLIIRLKKLRKFFNGIESDFMKGLEYFILVLILTSVYSSNLNFTFLWIFLGLVQALVIHYNRQGVKAYIG